MANWCSNTVVFEGTPEAIEQVQQLFKAMAEKEKKEKCGQLPIFLKDFNEGFFFDIYQEDDVTGVFQYETQWSPNIEAVYKIAELCKVDCTLDYQELGGGVYGRATFIDGIRTNYFLKHEDFGQLEFDQETDTFHFEGKNYDSEYDILETILERKIQNHFNSIKSLNNEIIK